MTEDYPIARKAERATYAAMSREQLVAALEGAMAACRIADRQLAEDRAALRDRDEAIAERDRELRIWASAFAPNRPLGARLP